MTQQCPYCSGPLEYANEVDIGVGMMHGGPLGCDACQAVQIAPELDREKALVDGTIDADEARTGFYKGKLEPVPPPTPPATAQQKLDHAAAALRAAGIPLVPGFVTPGGTTICTSGETELAAFEDVTAKIFGKG